MAQRFNRLVIAHLPQGDFYCNWRSGVFEKTLKPHCWMSISQARKLIKKATGKYVGKLQILSAEESLIHSVYEA